MDDVELSTAVTEECDDGNNDSGDGCSPICTTEECGSDYLDPGEECDDGNLEAGDGCSPGCEFEFCGDGTEGVSIGYAEDFEITDLSASMLAWDDSSTYTFALSGDQYHAGATSIGPTNTGLSSTTATVSMDATIWDGEICFWYAGSSESGYDDFRFLVDSAQVMEVNGTHTTWTQLCEPVAAGSHTFSWVYYKDSSTSSGWDAYFVDDVELPAVWTEECDDGNNDSGDGCSPVCINEECGNGILDPDEECDDGDTDPLDGCDAECALEYCGDGVVNWSIPFDGLETGDLSQLPWTVGGASGGFAVTDMGTDAHEGSYVLLSQNHDNSTTGWAEISIETGEGEVCYWYRGVSESGYDYLRFYVDGGEEAGAAASGTVGSWTRYCASVNAGSHVFRWAYSKDSSASSGVDRFGIDSITLPLVPEDCDVGDSTPGDGCGSNCLDE